MIRLEEFWCNCCGCIYDANTMKLIDSEEMLKRKNERVVSFEVGRVWEGEKMFTPVIKVYTEKGE